MNEFAHDDYLRINEIKNYLYCPRISYYALCLRIDRETDLSRGGIAAEAKTKRLMKRRKQALHAVHEGIRHFDVQVISDRLRLIGRIDEIIETDTGVFLVDYKDTVHDYGYWQMQLTAYQLAAIEQGMTVLGSYIYTIPDQHYQSVSVVPGDERKLIALITALSEMITAERCPPPVSHLGKCRSCQYANLCGDIF